MIFWKSKEVPEDRPNFPCQAFRWALEGIVGPKYSLFGIVHQYKIEDKWNSSHTLFYGFSIITNVWRFGFDHFYYDGPHCSFAVGPFRINWGGNPMTGWCTKCMPDESEK